MQFEPLVRAFYARVEKDPALRPHYSRHLECPIRQLTYFLDEQFGGTHDYTERRAYPRLHRIHARFDIGPVERDAWLANMLAAVDEIGIPEPLRSSMQAYFERASLALIGGGEVDRHFALERLLEAVEARDEERIRSLMQRADLEACIAKDGIERLEILAAFASSGAPLVDQAVAAVRSDPTLAQRRCGASQTLLHRAAAAWCVPMAAALLEAGADPNSRDVAGHVPLYHAGNCRPAAGDVDRLVELFARHGADLDAADGVKKCTPLHMAARRGHASLAAALVRHGADIEARDVNGETPLRRAVNCRQRDVARVLLELGADADAVDRRGTRVVDAARDPALRALFRIA